MPVPGENELKAATLSWRGQQPYSETFGDIYHDEDGPAEVRRTFLEPTKFSELARSRAKSGQSLLIGELGFGTGLNFAVAATVCKAAGAALHFVSFDAAPLQPADMAKVARMRRRESPIYAELSGRYPPLISGWHRRFLASGSVTLSVFWGTAAEGVTDILNRQQRPFDAWFLDGFAPDRNPDMWTPALMANIGALSAADTRVATFTAAGSVRRGLQAAGFDMRRVDQRPFKRESLAGVFAGTKRSARRATSDVITVVGAGLAGASAARHLADAGRRIQVLEAGDAIGSGASGINATVLHGRLLAGDSAQAELRLHSFLYSAEYCDHWHADPRSNPYQQGPQRHRQPGRHDLQTGVLQLAGPNLSSQRLGALAERYLGSGDWLQRLTPEDASELARWQIDQPALWFRNARALATPELCRKLLGHPAIEVKLRTRLTDLHAASRSGPVILACAADVRSFAAARYLEVAPVAGQIDVVDTAVTPALPIVGNGYLVPTANGLAVGATYEYSPWSLARASRANLAQLGRRRYRHLGNMRGVRAVASDRTSVVGQLTTMDGDPVPNVYVSTGHGSAGTVSSHFGAALLNELLGGDFAAMTRSLIPLLAPARFRGRQVRRGYRQGAEP